MATIKFLLQSTKNPANIYVSLIDGRKVDVKTKTNFVINPADWSETKQRPKNLKNEALKNLDSDLQNLRTNQFAFLVSAFIVYSISIYLAFFLPFYDGCF